MRTLNRTKDFSERLPGDERAALQARNRGRGGRGVGRAQGLQTYLEPGTKPSLNHRKRSLIEELATFWCSNIEQDDEYEPNLNTF